MFEHLFFDQFVETKFGTDDYQFIERDGIVSRTQTVNESGIKTLHYTHVYVPEDQGKSILPVLRVKVNNA